MDSKRKYFLVGVLISVIGALCFSSKAIFVKLGYKFSEADALTLLVIRMIGAFPFFAISTAWSLQKESNRKNIGFKTILQIAFTGCLGYYVASLLDFEGLGYVSAGLERLILFIYPTLVLGMSRIFFKQQISRLQWVAVFVTYAGILMAIAGEYNLAEEFRLTSQKDLLTGTGLILGCAVAYAGYISGSSSIIPKIGASLFNSLAMLAASLGVFIHYFIAGQQSLLELSQPAWTYGLLMALFATVIPSYLITESIRRIGGNNTAIIASIGPVSTILMAWWWLDESVTLWQLAGTACTLAGVWLISRGK